MPPSTAPERHTVLALATVAFALNLNTNVLGALLPFVRDQLQLGDGDAQWLVAGAGGGAAAGALAAGALARRFGRRAALIGGLVCFVAASLAHLLAGSFAALLVCRVGSALAVGAAYALASALVADAVPYARRGGAMGRFNAGLFLAIPVGLPLTVLLASAGHWSLIFALQGTIGALAGWAVLRTVPAAESRAPTRARLRLLWSVPAVAVLAANMLHVGSFFTCVQLAAKWLDESGLVRGQQQILLWVGFGALSVAGSALFGRLADRLGKQNFVLATSAVLAGCFALLAREPGPVLLLVIGAVLAIAAAARTGPLQALLSGLVPAEQLAALMGLRGFTMQLGVFAFAMGAVPIGAAHGFPGVLMLAAGCQLLSYLAIRFGARSAR